MTLRGRMGLCMPKILNKYARRKSEGFTEAMFLQHIDFYGADNRSRTYDLRITNALLYQLSYIGPERPVTSVTTGQKVRSIRVMRQCPFESNGYFCITRDYLRTNRIVAEADPLVSGQGFQTHRTARVQFLRADRHLSAEAELAAVGEAGGGIHIYR